MRLRNENFKKEYLEITRKKFPKIRTRTCFCLSHFTGSIFG
ncbi:hypothetical protein O59_003971 [Cellvibrio sp. BR]|nr:hypothetical protein O59_003971 [Cellvibrio sp. BR]